MTVKRMDIKELRELGLLAELNRIFFHPLGLALEIKMGKEEGDPERLGGIWDYRDDPEGIVYEPEFFEAEVKEKVERAMGFIKVRHKKRMERLGFIFQGEKVGDYFIPSKVVDDVRKLTEVQCDNGNWNYDPYMHGMANGMILVLAMLEGKEPDYLKAPEEWLSDKGEGTPELACNVVEPGSEGNDRDKDSSKGEETR